MRMRRGRSRRRASGHYCTTPFSVKPPCCNYQSDYYWVLIYCLAGSYVLNKRSWVNKARGRRRQRESRLLLLSDGNPGCPQGMSVMRECVFIHLSPVSPNTSIPRPCGLLMICWTVNIGGLPSDTLFMRSLCTGSVIWAPQSWYHCGENTLPVKPTAIRCP